MAASGEFLALMRGMISLYGLALMPTLRYTLINLKNPCDGSIRLELPQAEPLNIMKNKLKTSRPLIVRSLVRLSCGLSGVLLASQVQAVDPAPLFEWDLELTSMDMNATTLLPLGPEWAEMLTDVHIGESASLKSAGKAWAFVGVEESAQANGLPQAGQRIFVQSFFDVFFDITVTDVDPAQNFGGSPTDGLTMDFPNNGPIHFQNFYFALFDPNAPNFGLIPPAEAAPYIGGFTLEIPIGADLNGNGENDKIKSTLMAITVGDENRTFIILPDGTVVDNFDATLDWSGGVVDESQDPPFSFTLTGPTTGTSKLVGPSNPVPEGGATLGLLALASGAMLWRGRGAGRP